MKVLTERYSLLVEKKSHHVGEELEELDMSYSSSRKPTTKIREDNYGESHHETEGEKMITAVEKRGFGVFVFI